MAVQGPYHDAVAIGARLARHDFLRKLRCEQIEADRDYIGGES